MITAQEARGLSPKTPEQYALDFEDAIKEAAKKGERKLRIYHGELEHEAYSRTKKWQDFVDYMTGLGYEVSLYYMERQFVEMQIDISWGIKTKSK